MVNYVWTRIALNSKSRLVVNSFWSINFQASSPSNTSCCIASSCFQIGVSSNVTNHRFIIFSPLQLRVSRHEQKRPWKILRLPDLCDVRREISVCVTLLWWKRENKPCFCSANYGMDLTGYDKYGSGYHFSYWFGYGFSFLIKQFGFFKPVSSFIWSGCGKLVFLHTPTCLFKVQWFNYGRTMSMWLNSWIILVIFITIICNDIKSNNTYIHDTISRKLK